MTGETVAMDPDRKWPVLLAFMLLVACCVAAVVRDWQWAFMAAAAMVLVLTLVVGTNIKSLGATVGKEGASVVMERAERTMEFVAGALASPAVPDTGTTHKDVEAKRREQVEQLMAAAAEWGWIQAKAGAFTSVPRPVVEWKGDKPKILYGVADRSQVQLPTSF